MWGRTQQVFAQWIKESMNEKAKEEELSECGGFQPAGQFCTRGDEREWNMVTQNRPVWYKVCSRLEVFNVKKM